MNTAAAVVAKLSTDVSRRAFGALLAWDAARFRGWVRLGAKDPAGLGFSLVLIAAVLGAATVAGWRLAALAADDVRVALAAGIGAVALGHMIQSRFGWRADGGPLEAATLNRRAFCDWTRLRVGLAGAPGAVALGAGLVRIGAVWPLAALAVGFVGAVMAVGMVPYPTDSEAAPVRARIQADRIRPSWGLWSLARLSLAPRSGVLVAAFVAWCGAGAADAARSNGADVLAPPLALAAGVGAGLALRRLDPDLLSILAVTRQPLWRLLGAFLAAPVVGAMLGAGVAAWGARLGWIEGLALAGAAAALIAVWIATDALNLLAYGPTGPIRTVVYAGVLAMLLQAVGPVAVLAVAVGAVLLWRLAGRRRWRGL